MKKLLIPILCWPFLANSPCVHATNMANSASVTLGAAANFFDSKRNIKDASGPFVAVGYNFTNHWGIEGLLGSFRTKFKRREDNRRGISGTQFAFNGIYHFSPLRNNVQPFVLAGVGILGLDPNGTDAHNEGNVNAGLGVQIFFDPVVALRLEARDAYTFIGGKNDLFLGLGVTFLLPLNCTNNL